MVLKDRWIDKVNGEDVVDASHINEIAHAVIELEKNGTSIELDTALTEAGKAADAKAVGDAIENIPKQILDPDNYPLDDTNDSGTSTSETVINLEIGKLTKDTGAERDGEGGLRTPEYVPITADSTIYFNYDEDTYGRVCLMFFDSSYTILSDWNEGRSYMYPISDVGITCPSNAFYFKAYFSTELTEGTLIFSGEPTEEVTTRAEFKKIYIADHGYSIYGDMIDDETMHKIVIKAEGKDGNSYNITEIKAPSDNPEEATIALMNWGNGHKQFVDFSSMVYDPDNPTVEIVCQSRGGMPLPQFSVRFNDGEGAGRVRKFVVEPDCIPIRLTSEGLEVRRNNNYDNDAEESELVTINLADLYDTVAALGGSGECNLPDVAPKPETELIPITEGSFTHDSSYDWHSYMPDTILSLAIGDKCKIVWDSKEYYCTVIDASTLMSGFKAMGNLSGFGLSGNNEPFIIGFNDSVTTVVAVEDTEPATHSFAIYKVGASPDEEKFLQVVDGKATWVTIELAEDGGF